MDTDAYDDTDYGKFPLGVDDKGDPVDEDEDEDELDDIDEDDEDVESDEE